MVMFPGSLNRALTGLFLPGKPNRFGLSVRRALSGKLWIVLRSLLRFATRRTGKLVLILRSSVAALSTGWQCLMVIFVIKVGLCSMMGQFLVNTVIPVGLSLAMHCLVINVLKFGSLLAALILVVNLFELGPLLALQFMGEYVRKTHGLAALCLDLELFHLMYLAKIGLVLCMGHGMALVYLLTIVDALVTFRGMMEVGDVAEEMEPACLAGQTPMALLPTPSQSYLTFLRMLLRSTLEIGSIFVDPRCVTCLE